MSAKKKVPKRSASSVARDAAAISAAVEKNLIANPFSSPKFARRTEVLGSFSGALSVHKNWHTNARAQWQWLRKQATESSQHARLCLRIHNDNDNNKHTSIDINNGRRKRPASVGAPRQQSQQSRRHFYHHNHSTLFNVASHGVTGPCTVTATPFGGRLRHRQGQIVRVWWIRGRHRTTE